MKLSEFLKERENARADKFKQCMDMRKNKRIAFYKLVSEALKDSNYWEDAVKIRKGALDIGGIRLTLNRDISNTISDIGLDCRSPRYVIRLTNDTRHITGLDITGLEVNLPTIHDPYATITFSFVSSLDNNIDVDNAIESIGKFIDFRIDELMKDPAESEEITADDEDVD